MADFGEAQAWHTPRSDAMPMAGQATIRAGGDDFIRDAGSAAARGPLHFRLLISTFQRVTLPLQHIGLCPFPRVAENGDQL